MTTPTSTWIPGPRRREVGDGRGRRLVFAPLAWLKLQFLCHAGPTEVAATSRSSNAIRTSATVPITVRVR